MVFGYFFYLISVLKIRRSERPVSASVRRAVHSREMTTESTMQFFVLRVASNKEDRVREALSRKVKIEGAGRAPSAASSSPPSASAP